MTYDTRRRVVCPLCESEGMFQIHPFLARCTECEDTISYGFFNTLRQVRNLRDARGKHPCECGHPEMRRFPDGVYRCPSCSTQISYPTWGDKESSELSGISSPPKSESRNSRHRAEDQVGENEKPLFRDKRRPG